MHLSEIALATKGQLLGADVEVNSVGTDSRAIQPQQLFVALKGENFDGHDYAAQSLQQGAAAALVPQTPLESRRAGAGARRAMVQSRSDAAGANRISVLAV